MLLKPSLPPLYLLDGSHGPHKVDLTPYTRNELQVINSEEEYPDSSIIKNPEKVKSFRIQKILAKKKVKGKWMLQIQWRGYKDPTWEPLQTIKEDAPDLVRQFLGAQAWKFFD